MKNILICGTGELAREVYYWVKQSEDSNIKLKGFLGIDSNSLIDFKLDYLYLGNENSYNFENDDYVIIAIADTDIREMVYLKLKDQKANLINYIHPSVIVGSELDIGEANIICPNSVFTTNISVGNANIFNVNVTVGHDVSIGSYNTINSHCDITGNAKLQDNNFLGSRVSLLPKCKIGSNNKIAAGSVVYKGIKDNFIYMGNPASKVGSNE